MTEPVLNDYDMYINERDASGAAVQDISRPGDVPNREIREVRMRRREVRLV